LGFEDGSRAKLCCFHSYMLGRNNKHVFELERKKFIREKLFLSKNTYNYRRSMTRIERKSTSKLWFKGEDCSILYKPSHRVHYFQYETPS
jgi:hypothetical protein